MSKSKTTKRSLEEAITEDQAFLEDQEIINAIIVEQEQELEEEALEGQEEEVAADFLFRGRPYTYETLSEEFDIKSELLVTTVDLLKQKGYITDLNPDTREKFIKKVEKEATAIEAGKEVLMDEYKEETYKIESKRKNVPTYESVEFEFGTQAKLNDFRRVVCDLRLTSEILLDENGFYILRVFNITDKELGKLSTLYKTNKVVTAGVKKTEELTDKSVQVVDYTVKNIAAPVAKAGFGAGVKILKTLATGLFRMGAMATTEVIEGTRLTAYEIKNDPNVAVAKAELIQAKNDILDKTGRTAIGNTAGIRVNR